MRPGSAVLDADGRAIGSVTSAVHSPTLGAIVGMAYIDAAAAGQGTPAFLAAGAGPAVPVEIVPVPFARGQ